MQSLRVLMNLHTRTIRTLVFLALFGASVTFATPPVSPYTPGATLDPLCTPGSTNCTVQIIPAQTGNTNKLLTTSGSVTSWTDTLTGISLSGATNTLSNIPNSALTNSTISINGAPVALGGSVSNLALTTSPLSQFAATTSSQLAGVLGDETGTGSVVYSVSPTLTTPNIGVATGTSLDLSSGTITSGLINGQTISSAANFTGSMSVTGNVGIGTITPARNLHIDAGVNVAYVMLSNTASGTTVSDGLQLFTTGVNATISNRENGFLSFETNNLERVRVGASGNVLIGTIADDTVNKLQVDGGIKGGTGNFSGNVTTSGNTYASFIANGGSSTGGGGINFQRQGVSSGLIGVEGFITGGSETNIAIFADASRSIKFMTGGSVVAKSTLTADGNFLIATTSDDGVNKLQVNGGIKGTVGKFGNAGANAALEVAASSGEVFRADAASGAYRIIVDQTGVSLGGTITAPMLLVGGGSAYPYLNPVIAVSQNTNSTVSNVVNNQFNGSGAYAKYIAAAYGNSWHFGMGSSTSTYGNDFTFTPDASASNTPVFRLSTSGAATFSSGVTVGGTIYGEGNAIFRIGGTNILNIGADQYMYGGSNNDGGMFVYGANKLHLSTNSSRRLTIDGNGNVGIGTTEPLATLDVRGNIRNTILSGAGGDMLISAISGVSNGLRITTNTSNEISYTFQNGSNTTILTLANSGAATFSSTGLFTGRTLVYGGGIRDISGSGNDIGIAFSSSGLLSTNGGGSAAVRDFGSSSNRWGAVYAQTGDFSSSVTASSFIRSGGTSSQFLKADGSIDSTSYVNASGSANRIPFYNSSGTISSSANFTYNSAGDEIRMSTDFFSGALVTTLSSFYDSTFIGNQSYTRNVGGNGIVRSSTAALSGMYLGAGGLEFYTAPSGGTPDTYASAVLRFSISNSGSVRLAAYGAGTLTTDSSGNITASSDERLKTIEGEFNRGLTEVLSIDTVLYRWNEMSGYDTEAVYAGFIAQNIQGVIPEAVGEDNRGYLTLNDRPILAATINAIKELDIKVQAIPSLTDQTLYEKIATFLQGIAEQGIAFVDGVKTKDIETENLCIKKSDGTPVCVNGDQLYLLLGNSSGSISGDPESLSPEEPTQPSCSDGIQNQDETSVDSGGVCSPQDTQTQEENPPQEVPPSEELPPQE